jgi:hypothetical protein
MKLRTIVILALVLIVLVGFSVWTSREPASSSSVGPMANISALEGLDVNQVAEVDIVSASGTNRLAKKSGKWVVASLFNYPADFQQVAGRLRSLSDLKPGQVVRGGTEHLDEIGLAQDQSTQIRMKDSSGKILASLALGSMRQSKTGGPYGGFPQGQYFRVGEGPVVLSRDPLPAFAVSNEGWIQRDLWTVPPEEIAEVTVTSTQKACTIRQPSPGRFQVDGLSTNEQVDAGQAGRLMRVFQPGLVHSVADPARSEKELGLDSPDAFVAKTRDGIIYTILLGSNAVPAGRYAKLKVEYEKPAAPTIEEVKASMPPTSTLTNAAASTNNSVQKINEEFERRTKSFEEKSAEVRKRAEEQSATVRNWVYVFSPFVADSMRVNRDQLVKKVEVPVTTSKESEPVPEPVAP